MKSKIPFYEATEDKISDMKEEIDLVMEEHFDLKSVLKIPILEAKIEKLE